MAINHRTAVVIPWRANGDLQRARNLNVVSEWFRLQGAEPRTFDSQTEVFSRPAARNAGAQWALDEGYGVVVVCDADCIPDQYGMTQAITSAESLGGLHYPFEVCLYLTTPEADSYLYDPPTYVPNRPGGAVSGGCFVIRPEDWFASGGMDERLATWGGEDDAFYVSQSTLVAPPTYHDGLMYHLPHARDEVAFGTTEHQENLTLLYRYSGSSGNPKLMEGIIREWRSDAWQRPSPQGPRPQSTRRQPA